MIPGSADREDVDPPSTAIAFEPCRVDDALPAELIGPTSIAPPSGIAAISARRVSRATTRPTNCANINAFVALGRFDDAYRLLAKMLDSRRPRGWRVLGRGRLGRSARARLYRRHAAHLDRAPSSSRRFAGCWRAKAATRWRLFGAAPDCLVGQRRRHAARPADRLRRPQPAGAAETIAGDGRVDAVGAAARTGHLSISRRQAARADGKPCKIQRDVILAPSFSHLVIDF